MSKTKNLLPNIILFVILVSGLVFASWPSTTAKAEDKSETIEPRATLAPAPQDQVQTSLPGVVYEGLSAEEVPFVETTDRDELLALIDAFRTRKDAAHQMAEAARELGYAETHDVITLAKEEWTNANNQQKQYQAIYDEQNFKVWDTKLAEYPNATQVWLYLKDLGYNDYICAGIIGNLMAECGGQTLDLQVTISGNGYYGMCQWNKVYCEGVWGKDLKGQCDFLRDTIQYEIDTFGFCYRKGFKYVDFLELDNEKDAALAFAKSYERCGSGSYTIRQKNATKAYEYFVG